jgi:NAD(P)-dependent dehydrogenase (short-subunit alcohol dehydrogenase family)
MSTHNSINTEVYAAIDPSNFTGKLKGKTVFITGAGRGIGQGIAIAFAKAGATLSLVDLKKENLDETVKECENLGSEVLAQACNVVDTKAVDAALAAYIIFYTD